MTPRPLGRAFYAPSASAVAPGLLGHWLLRRTPEGFAGGPIVETEAYLADDPASHGFMGPTARNGAMFGPPGHAYVYFIYGCHYCVNAVCRPAGAAEAVLIRAIAPEFGVEYLRRNRPGVEIAQLTNGPAKLCQALGIGRGLDGANLCDRQGELLIARNPAVAAWRTAAGPLVRVPRVGITRAATLPLRFFFRDSALVSRRAGRGR
jgi:DNA-3-methyladenine glycosylase